SPSVVPSVAAALTMKGDTLKIMSTYQNLKTKSEEQLRLLKAGLDAGVYNNDPNKKTAVEAVFDPLVAAEKRKNGEIMIAVMTAEQFANLKDPEIRPLAYIQRRESNPDGKYVLVGRKSDVPVASRFDVNDPEQRNLLKGQQFTPVPVLANPDADVHLRKAGMG